MLCNLIITLFPDVSIKKSSVSQFPIKEFRSVIETQRGRGSQLRWCLTPAASRGGRGWWVCCGAPETRQKCERQTGAHSDLPSGSSPHMSAQKGTGMETAMQSGVSRFTSRDVMEHGGICSFKTNTTQWNSRSACRGYISSGRRRWRRGGCGPPVSECKSWGRKTGWARRWRANQRIVAGRGCGWRSWTWWPRCPDWTLSAWRRGERKYGGNQRGRGETIINILFSL